MKKKILFFVLCISCFCLKMQAQVVLCNTIPLSYNHDSIDFTTAVPVSFGDSMITFQITNDHLTQAFAYPLAKLVPLTPLPPGMALSQGSVWTVFASSWNAGVTMPVSIFYNVTAPIPVNYSVTFQLWVSNLLPLLIDSCYFDSTFTVNLNPSALSVNSFQSDLIYSIYPEPVQNYLYISWNSPLNMPMKISLFTTSGSKVIEANVMKGATDIMADVRSLSSGIYFLSIEEKGRRRAMKKVVVANK